MNKLRKAWWVVRHLGLRIVWLRLGVYLGKFTGRTRKVFASRSWESLTLERLCRADTPTDVASYAAYRVECGRSFLFPLGRPPEPVRMEGKLIRQPTFSKRLEGLREMRCVYTFLESSPEPIDWYRNPFVDGHSDPEPLWCDVPLYLPEQGDPRMMWESGRAAWALDWGKAAAHGTEDAADELWRWIDSWMEACPPYHGIQWWCGQESSVRLVAILVGAWACGEIDGERWMKLLRLAWATGYRVEHHINYAISQKNNHAISEALGLMLAGHLFPELKESKRWFKRGREVMIQELRRQCYADGSYLQHSMNYHRVMLEGAMLGLRVAELAGQPMDQDIYETLGRSAMFLYQMTDPHTGMAPNYGNNDGAHIFPLSECDFRDMRPAVQAAYFVATRKRLLESGPWDEELHWLMGSEAADRNNDQTRSDLRLDSQAFDVGGYYTLRDTAADTWLMTRCHRYHDRMGQCDMLHVDLWAGGVNWLRDSGTYQYYLPGQPNLERFFGSQAAHNVLQIDGKDSGQKIGRFLIFPWSNASCLHRRLSDGSGCYFEGISRDYQRSPSRSLWKRAIFCVGEGIWVVVDDVVGTGEHSVRWWWHLCSGNHELTNNEGECVQVSMKPEAGPVRKGMLAVSCGGEALKSTLISADESAARTAAIASGEGDVEAQGIVSTYYGHCFHTPVLEVGLKSRLPLRCVTALSVNGSVEVAQVSSGRWTVRTPHREIVLFMSELCRETDKPVILRKEEVKL